MQISSFFIDGRLWFVLKPVTSAEFRISHLDLRETRVLFLCRTVLQIDLDGSIDAVRAKGVRDCLPS